MVERRETKRIYEWAPDWSGLDDDALVYFFCLYNGKISISRDQWSHVDMPFRLQQMFEKRGRRYIWNGDPSRRCLIFRSLSR